jgi:hypothetical protein
MSLTVQSGGCRKLSVATAVSSAACLIQRNRISLFCGGGPVSGKVADLRDAQGLRRGRSCCVRSA